MQHIRLLTFLLLAASVALLARANPAIEREFRRVVNSNECLKACMTPVQESRLELSIFKRSNFTDYLLNVDRVCTLIGEARACIDACRIESNPFALLSVNAICGEKSREEAALLKPCLEKEGPRVHEECNQICGGDYEKITDDIHLKTSTMKPEDQEAAAQLAAESGNACILMKCSSRCVADHLNRRCSSINGQMAGDRLRDLVERILKMHRLDLEVFHLLDALKAHTPAECNYLFTPDALFSPLRDALTQEALRRDQQQKTLIAEAPRQNAAARAAVIEQPMERPQQQQQPNNQQQQLASRLYVRILKKQLQVLDKQLALLNKQEQKMDAPADGETMMPRFMQKPPARFAYTNEMF